MKNIIYTILVVGLCISAFGQISPRFGGTIKIGIPAEITTIYPWKMTDTETVYVLENIYEPLIRLKRDSAGIEPCLATSWKPSADYKTWTINLRKDVTFHDGTPLTTDIVIASFKQNPLFTSEIKKIDDYTLSFILERPNAAFAITLSLQYYIIAGPATIKCFKENCKKVTAVGTGPYKLYEWVKGKRVVLRANKNYWGGRPYLDEAQFISYAKNPELIQALKTNKIDMAPIISTDNIGEIKQMQNVIFQSRPALNIAYLGMNTEKDPFKNKKIRIAISYAINKTELVNKYYYKGEAGATAKSCLPPAMFGYYKELPEREYDPVKAKKLLAEAGYPDGFSTTLLPPPVNRAYLPDPAGIAHDIQQYLAKIGIKAEIIKSNSYKEFRDDVHAGKYEMMIYGWIADTIDPNDYLTSLLISSSINISNSTRWSNERFDNLVYKARGEGVSDRAKTYREAQMVFYEEMPFIPIVNSLLLGSWNEKVQGFQLHPASRFFLQHIWLSE